MKKKRVSVHVRMDPDIVEYLDNEMKAMSRSAAIHVLVNEAIDNAQRDDRALKRLAARKGV